MTLINADDVFFQGVAALLGLVFTVGGHQEGCVRPEKGAVLAQVLDGVSVPVSLEVGIFWDGLEPCLWEGKAIILREERNLK